jgi:hypothetical protein
LELPGAQESFGHLAQLLDVIAAVNRSLVHRDRKLAAEGGLFHG